MKTICLFLILVFTIPSLNGGKLKAQNAGENPLRQVKSDDLKESRVYYSVFIQSFYDSNGDGIGDLNGLTSKLDYLKELGIGGLSLLPIHPSPSYHKYDIVDYMGIHKDYGTLDDFKELLSQAHERKLKVLIDLVVNSTSNQHPWFKKAINNNDKYRKYYLWSDDKTEFDKNPFQWHQVRDKKGQKTEGERYYGSLWWELPELNFDNQDLREEVFEIGRFWLQDIGVDGFRVDEAKNIYPDDQTHKTLLWWKEFNQEMKKINPDVILVGEVMGGSEKASPFLKSGFNSTLNFEMADIIIKSVLTEKDLGIIKTYTKIDSLYSSSNPDYLDATLLSNHDMERVMTQFNRDASKAKLSAGLLLTLPGNPFLYYGEEIGMLGEKPDEYIREPFVWNVENEDKGQTIWEIPYASSSRTVKPLFYQLDDRASVYNHYKNLIKLRNDNPALSKGQISSIETSNSKVLAFYRYTEDQEAIVIINFGSELERIPTLYGLDGFAMAYSNFMVFKINDQEISLQPHAMFVLTKSLPAVK